MCNSFYTFTLDSLNLTDIYDIYNKYIIFIAAVYTTRFDKFLDDSVVWVEEKTM